MKKKTTAKINSAKKICKTAPKINNKASVSKSYSKNTSKTTIAARVDVGFGNNLYIRGNGGGLSWDVGTLMKNLSPYEWVWESKKVSKTIEYKLIINDELWANGENQFANPNSTSICAPTFDW